MKTLLVAINAKNVHKALAPWCLKAYCEVRGLSGISVLETNINDRLIDTVGKIYNAKPDIVGFGLYIWNIDYTLKVAEALRRLLPHLIIIVGGPEINSNSAHQYPYADHIIQGVGEAPLYKLLKSIPGTAASIDSEMMSPTTITGMQSRSLQGRASPYTAAYFDSFGTDQIPSINNRLVYYESSRGCPYACSYCLSSVAQGIEYKPIRQVKDELSALVERGATTIKFVDRTFNSDTTHANAILEHILSLDTDCTFHLEIVADRLGPSTLDLIARMPRGRIQFEVGIQSTHPPTLKAINRRQNSGTLLERVAHLISIGNSHVHVDLIAGLPLESLQSFRIGFDRTMAIRPHRMQLGFLKILKSTRLAKETAKYGITFCPHAPYEVLSTSTMSFDDILRLKDLEGCLNRFYNSGHFDDAMTHGAALFNGSYFDFLDALAIYCQSNDYGSYRISLPNATRLLEDFLKTANPKSN